MRDVGPSQNAVLRPNWTVVRRRIRISPTTAASAADIRAESLARSWHLTFDLAARAGLSGTGRSGPTSPCPRNEFVIPGRRAVLLAQVIGGDAGRATQAPERGSGMPKGEIMTNLRRSLITIIAVLAVGVAAACSPGGGSSAEPSAPAGAPTEMPSESASPYVSP